MLSNFRDALFEEKKYSSNQQRKSKFPSQLFKFRLFIESLTKTRKIRLNYFLLSKDMFYMNSENNFNFLAVVGQISRVYSIGLKIIRTVVRSHIKRKGKFSKVFQLLIWIGLDNLSSLKQLRMIIEKSLPNMFRI